MIERGDLVTVHYAFWVEPGRPLESTFEGEPETVTLGAGELPTEIEKILETLDVGETRECTFAAEDAVFGVHEMSRVKRMSREDFGGVSCKPGALVEFEMPNGECVTGRIERTEEDRVIVDFNNPLSGRDVHCKLQVIKVDKAPSGEHA